jgi:hypothetical protein
MCRRNTWGMGISLGRSGERWADYTRSSHNRESQNLLHTIVCTLRAGASHWFALAQVAPKSEVRRIARRAVVSLPKES